jgi:hypothetical protein
MKRRPSLGRMDEGSLKKVQSHIVNHLLKLDRHGLSYLEDYTSNKSNPEMQAYGYLNALGNQYGYAMAEAFLEGFLSARTSEEAAQAAREASKDMDPWILDAMERAPSLSTDVIRQAIAEVGDRLPKGAPPEEMIKEALKDPKGIYIKDFYYSLAGALQLAKHAVENFLAWHLAKYPVEYDEEAREYVPELFSEPTRQDYKRAVKSANEEIRKRTYYGLREENLPNHPNFTILGWSNGAEEWHIMYGLIEPAVRQVMLYGGGPIRLDANYILVEAHPKVMQAVLPELEPLPLHEYSLEAKIKGKYPYADDRTVRKVLRVIVDAEYPEVDQEERALMAIDLWEAFVEAKQGSKIGQEIVEQFLLNLKNPSMPYFNILDQWFTGPEEDA